MLDAIDRITGQTSDRTYELFSQDRDAMEIVAWNFHVLGEASTRIPNHVMKEHPEIPWSDMRTMRNRVVHGYFHLNPQILWDTATAELPPLVQLLQSLAASANEGTP